MKPVTDRCWCGVENPYCAPLPSRCGGSGTIDCHCGGDQCVCHWHGEVECFGCPDCQLTIDDDMDAVIKEHGEMVRLLMRTVDVMRVTQRLFQLSDEHFLINRCREIEAWLDKHQGGDK